MQASSFKIGLEKIHTQKFKVKLIFTNQGRGCELVHIENTMMHR
jgi:hypothetical protein